MTKDREEMYNTINTMYNSRQQIRELYNSLDNNAIYKFESNIESTIKHQLKNKCTVSVCLTNYIIQVVPEEELSDRIKNNLLNKVSGIIREFIINTTNDYTLKDYVSNPNNSIFDFYTLGTSINIIL